MSRNYLLAGDIGGTYSRLALYLGPSDESQDVTEAKYKDALCMKEYLNAGYVTNYGSDGFNHILNEFLKLCFSNDENECSNCAIVACIACAGPIRKNALEFTKDANLQFVIRGDDIRDSEDGYKKLIKSCRIVNDFVGQGYGCLEIDMDTEVIELVPGSKKKIDPLGPKVCVGAGTGLGESFLTPNSQNSELGYECFPSEGGNVDYVPRTDLEKAMLTWMKHKFQHFHRIPVGRVVSGKGIADAYEFVASLFPDEIEQDVHKQFYEPEALQGKVVGENVREGNLCDKAMRIFMGSYGSEVGSCAFKWIPTGGLFVTGGIIGKVLESNRQYVEGDNSEFMKAYYEKGRNSIILDSVPLFAVKVKDMGLRGARMLALRELKNYLKSNRSGKQLSQLVDV